MYEFLTGPLFLFSVFVCVTGLAVRAVKYIRGLDWKLDRVAYTAHPGPGLKGAFRSIAYWLVPFGTRSWRTQPFMTVLFFIFHAGAVVVPVFLLAHNLFLKQNFGFSVFTLNPVVADILSWGVVVSGALLIVRRLTLPEIRIMAGLSDFLILAVSLAPFITGLICRYDPAGYPFWLLIHIFSGEVLLMAIPFTRLSHILLYFLSRAQIGMDFGIKRGGMKGKGMAW